MLVVMGQSKATVPLRNSERAPGYVRLMREEGQGYSVVRGLYNTG
jgi:hypothetical protein